MKRSSGSSRRAGDFHDNLEASAPIRRKLRDSRVKFASVVHRCELKDKNRDGFVHLDDLEDILNDIVEPEHRITRRELQKFATSVMGEKFDGGIEYEKLLDTLEPKRKTAHSDDESENWDDIDETETEGNTKWATQPGSVGAFLKRSACPSEIKNFKKFVACLEAFERDSGMKIHLKDDGGFSVPMGPDLRATISFSMA